MLPECHRSSEVYSPVPLSRSAKYHLVLQLSYNSAKSRWRNPLGYIIPIGYLSNDMLSPITSQCLPYYYTTLSNLFPKTCFLSFQLTTGTNYDARMDRKQNYHTTPESYTTV
jgi:hypothetical protein